MGGGWLEQPLSVLAKIGIMQLANDTYAYKSQEKADWSKFAPVQLELIRWLETDG